MPARNRNTSTSRAASAVRIIGGQHRGRRIPVPSAGVRPTPDRVRETIFNWLTPWIKGARCLDMFAGTGVLGFESLSRGAAAVLFIEKDRRVAAQIGQNLTMLGCANGSVIVADAVRLSYSGLGPFDIVYLDPPYGAIDLAVLCTLLESTGALAETAHIYMEMSRRQALPQLPAGWKVVREQTAGQVRYALAERLPEANDGE